MDAVEHQRQMHCKAWFMLRGRTQEPRHGRVCASEQAAWHTRLADVESESESDNATEGAIWKRETYGLLLSSGPITKCKNGSLTCLCSHQQRTIGVHPPSGGCCAISVRQYAVVKGCVAA